MSRAAWIFGFLLVATNAAWLLVWSDRTGPAVDVDVEIAERDQAIADLQVEVEVLRDAAAGSVVPGLEPAPGSALDVDGGAPGPGIERSEDQAAAVVAREAAEQARRVAMAAMQGALEKAKQVKDPALRAEGLREIADALSGNDMVLVELALGALYQVREIDIDRTLFTQLVLRHLDSEHGGVRRSALYALYSTDPDSAEIRFALAAATDPDLRVRANAARFLSMYSGKNLDGETAAAVLSLLEDEVQHVRKGTLRGLSGVHVTPEIEHAMIELSKRPEDAYDAVQFGLSTMEDKSREVVDALFTRLAEDANHQIRRRAHWGLQRGISDELKPYVALRYADHLDEFLSPKTHKEALQLIAKFGDSSLMPQVERFAENEMVDPRVREMAIKVVEYLANKSPDR